MPPVESGRQLTAAQIALLTRWVNEGARWNKHWAFVAPPCRPCGQRPGYAIRWMPSSSRGWKKRISISYNLVSHPVSVYDLQITLLHLLGIDHKRLTYIFQGRHFRLTNVHGELVEKILA
jgi:hypothetical protein